MNRQTIEFIREHARDDVRELALRPVPEGVDLRAALQQIEGRQLAAGKLPSLAATDGLLFPPRLSMEQCSSELTAAYKRDIALRLFRTVPQTDDSSRPWFCDLTGGFGVDFISIARLFTSGDISYVERNSDLCELARHNFPLLGLANAHILCSKAEDALAEVSTDMSEPRFTLLMIDPARRDIAGRKVALIEDCTPDVCALQQQLRTTARYTLIKLSPMLDIKAALRALNGIAEAHVVSVGGECKELLLVMGSAPITLPPRIYCVNLPDSSIFTFTYAEEEEGEARFATQLGTYVYEPDAAILKAGAFKTLCRHFPILKLAPDTHLYTADIRIDKFPGRCWKVNDISTFSKRELRQFLGGITTAELTVRGFPMSVATLRKQLHLREGGHLHLLATTLGTQRLLLKVERA